MSRDFEVYENEIENPWKPDDDRKREAGLEIIPEADQEKLIE